MILSTKIAQLDQILNMQEETRDIYFNQAQVPVAPHHPVMTEEFITIYREALKLSKLEVDNHIKFRNVLIYEKQHIHEVYTVGDKKLPHLVLLHGYGGTSLTYIRCFQYLRDRFQMHALDTFGVGLSSIGTWNEEHTPQEVANYYIDALEQWRKSVGLTQFILAGHSFGGYISILYYQKYPKAVKQLILLSPAGSSQLSEEHIKERQKNSRFFYCIAQKIYNMNIRPFKIMNTFWIGNKFIERMLNNRLKIPEEQQTVWKKYLKYVSAIENSSERGFYKLFGWPLQPMKSIQKIVKALKPKIKIDILFGDNDWMEKSGAYRLQQELPQQVTVHTVKNSGHQILFDNPAQLTNKIKDISK